MTPILVEVKILKSLDYCGKKLFPDNVPLNIISFQLEHYGKSPQLLRMTLFLGFK